MTIFLRGTGFKHTLRWVFPYFAVWVVVLVLTAPVLTIAMMYSDLVPEYLHGDIWFFLFTRMPLTALAGVGLRGPWDELSPALDESLPKPTLRRRRSRGWQEGSHSRATT